jgi:hypothetical protein
MRFLNLFFCSKVILGDNFCFKLKWKRLQYLYQIGLEFSLIFPNPPVVVQKPPRMQAIGAFSKAPC